MSLTKLTQDFEELLRKHGWQWTTMGMTGQRRYWNKDWRPEQNTWTDEQMMRELMKGKP